MRSLTCLSLFLVCPLAVCGCHQKPKEKGRSVVLLEAKRAEIVFTDEERQEGVLKLKYVSPSVARLNKLPNRTVAHFDVVDLIDDWYKKPSKKKRRISHGGFVFFENNQQASMRDLALTLSCPKLDHETQTLTFDIVFNGESESIKQSLQGVRLYIDD